MSKPRMICSAYGAAFSLIAAFGVFAALLSRGGDTAIAIFPPSMTAGQIFAAANHADARVLQFGATDWIAAIKGQRTGWQSRLQAAGALVLLDPRNAAALCGVTNVQYYGAL